MSRRIAVLRVVKDRQDPVAVLGQAVREFQLREDNAPAWVETGPDVKLPKGAARCFGLERRQNGCCRAGHLRVGRG